MVDFTQAQVGGPQGTPTTVQAPISDRSAELGVNLFTDLVRGVGKQQEAKREAESVDAGNTALANYSKQQLKLAQAVEQGSMSSAKARTLMRVNTSQFISDNPALREDTFKAHKSIVGGSGLGKVVAEGTQAEKLQIKLESTAALEGWLSPDMTDSEREEGVQNYLDNKAAGRALDKAQKDVSLATAKVGLSEAERKAALGKAKTDTQRALSQTASAWTKRAVSEVGSINKQVQQGAMSAQDGEVRLNQLKATLNGELSRMGAQGGGEYLNTIANPIMDVYDNGIEQVSGRMSTAAVKLANDRKVAIATNQLLQNESAVRIKAAQSLSNFANVITVGQITPVIVDFMEAANDPSPESEVANLTVSKNSEDAKNYLSIMKDNYKADGRKDTNEEQKVGIQNGVNDMLKSLPTHEGSIKSPKQVAELLNHYASQEFGSYSVANGAVMDQGAAAESVRVIQGQILNAVGPEIEKYYNTGFKIEGNVKSRVNPLPPTDVKVAVMPNFVNGAFVFTPRAEFINDPDVQARASRMTKDMAPAINKLIKAESHLSGHKSYATTYQNLLPAMFPGESGEEQLSGKIDRSGGAVKAPESPQEPITEEPSADVPTSREDLLRSSEGVREESYLDSKGNLTGGIGHLMSAEERKQYPEGSAIPKEVVDKWFKEDTATAAKESKELIDEHIGEEVPKEVEEILFDMTFNMGKSRLSKFKKTFAAIKNKDYIEAAMEMLDSNWARDVKGRSNDLARRMIALDRGGRNE